MRLGPFGTTELGIMLLAALPWLIALSLALAGLRYLRRFGARAGTHRGGARARAPRSLNRGGRGALAHGDVGCAHGRPRTTLP
jgi:hypothetical protein